MSAFPLGGRELSTAAALFARRLSEDDRVGAALASVDPEAGITDAEFDLVIEHLLESLEDAGASEAAISEVHSTAARLRPLLVRRR